MGHRVMTTNPTQPEYARLYHEVGISVFPLKFKDKIPVIKSWKKYQESHATIEVVDEWFGKSRFCNNIAVVGGKISKMVYLDFDAGESYDLCVTDEMKEQFLIVDTHEDRHHMWIKTEDDIKSIKRDKLHFEVKSNGTYVVAPYSLHPEGDTYKFQKSFEEVSEYLKNDDNMITGVQDMIDSFVAKLKDHYKVKRTEAPDAIDQDISNIFEGYPCYIGLFKNGAVEGERDTCAIILVSFLRNKRVKKGEIINLLLQWNERNYRILEDGTKELYPLEPSILIDKVEKGSKTYKYGCTKMKECSTIAKYCDEPLCRLNKKVKLERTRDSIISQTDKVIMYPGDPAYHEIHMGGEIFRATTKEMMRPPIFTTWYYENFGKAHTRITLPKWEEILEEWFIMSKRCKKEKVNDEGLFFESIVDQMSTFTRVKSLDDAVMANTFFDTNNGSVLISAKNIHKLVSKERKSTNYKMSMHKLAVLLKSKEYLQEDSSLPRKIKSGKKSVRFWKFDTKLFRDSEED